MATTPNFGWPTPDDTDQLSDGAAAIRGLGDAIDASVTAQGTAIAGVESALDGKVAKAGDTMTGALDAPNVGIGVTVAGSDTIALNFGTGDGFVTRTVSGSSVSITGTGYAPGRTKTVRIIGGAGAATLSVPAEWVFVGQAAGTAIGTAATVVVTATSFGTAAADVVAAFAEEA